jgi:nucleoside-diphosphate-sugar epimerase
VKIVVTGGAGYIGSMLVSDLLNSGHKVTVIDNLIYNQTSISHLIGNKNLEFVFKDIRNVSNIKNYYSQADVIIPLAAIVGAPACAKDPLLATSTNKDAIIDMLKILSINQRVIMPTTNSAYGSGNGLNYCDETSELNPLSLYAKDKVEIEKIVMNNHNATSFRLATVFGVSPRMRLDLLVNNFVHRALRDRFIVLFEGNFKRNYIHLNDVVQAFNLAINSPEKFKGQIFNVGLSNANISKNELCEKIKYQLPDFVYFNSDIGSDPDKRNYLVSNEKIEGAGFKHTVNLDDGIAELIKGLPIFQNKQFSNI